MQSSSLTLTERAVNDCHPLIPEYREKNTNTIRIIGTHEECQVNVCHMKRDTYDDM